MSSYHYIRISSVHLLAGRPTLPPATSKGGFREAVFVRSEIDARRKRRHLRRLQRRLRLSVYISAVLPERYVRAGAGKAGGERRESSEWKLHHNHRQPTVLAAVLLLLLRRRQYARSSVYCCLLLVRRYRRLRATDCLAFHENV